MAAQLPQLPDDTYVHKITDIEQDAAFPFDDIILSGNVIPGSILQNLMPPLEVHMNLNHPYKIHKQTENENENENKNENNLSQPKEPKHDPNNIFPPTLSRRIEMTEKEKTKTRKKKERNENNDSDGEDERTGIFQTAPSKQKPLDAMCARSLELQHGWKQSLFPGFANSS